MEDQDSLTLDKSKPKVEDKKDSKDFSSSVIMNLEHMTSNGWINIDESITKGVKNPTIQSKSPAKNKSGKTKKG